MAKNKDFWRWIEAALNVIGGKWKLLIVVALKDGTQRYNEISHKTADNQREDAGKTAPRDGARRYYHKDCLPGGSRKGRIFAYAIWRKTDPGFVGSRYMGSKLS